MPSTTQRVRSSRRWSVQKPQRLPSVSAKQRLQRRTLLFTSSSAATSSAAYSGGARRMWKASRWAVFSPMPGSLESWATSRFSGSGVIR